jgi:catalase-peroxidase
MSEESKCPITGKTGRTAASRGTSNREWWPNQLNLAILHQHQPASNPMGRAFKYAKEFKKLNLAAVKKDLSALMTETYRVRSIILTFPLFGNYLMRGKT